MLKKKFQRFLRARKFDIVKAKEMLLNVEQWRKDFGVDDIVKYVCFFFLFWVVSSRIPCVRY